mgnify:CR=1 FL=1
MKKRFFSLLTAFALCVTLIPTTAFADDEKRGEDVSPCICETACTAENMNADCAVCGAAGADPENCKCATVESEQKVASVSTSSSSTEDLVDPVIRIIPYEEGGYPAQSGTRTAADFFKPGEMPEGAKITAITPRASASVLDSISVDGNGTLSYAKGISNTGTVFKSETYTVTITITSDDYAPIFAPLTVRQYLDAGFGTGYNVSPWVYGDTRTWTWHVTNPGENGVWSAIMREQGIFEIYEETVDTTSEPGKSFYTIKYRAIKAGATFIDILYVSDTTASWSPWTYSNVVAGGSVSTRTLTVTAGSASITKGDALPTDLVTCTGLLDSEGRRDDRDTVLDNALSYRLLDASGVEVAADTARNTPGTYTVVPAAALKSGWEERYALSSVNGTLTVEKRIDEQFTLTPGGRYYFDLSTMNIPGTVNSALPDSTLHYVPFTYVGTVDAYKRTGVSDKNTDAYEHSLFIADYAVTHTVSWNDLNARGMIFGKAYTSGGIDYTLRAPSVGRDYTGGGETKRGAPINNEWDTIFDKAKQDRLDNTGGYIKNWKDILSFGQEGYGDINDNPAVRGYYTAFFYNYTGASSAKADYGYHPVLELPTGLSADSLKVVELITDGRMPGETYQSINIIVKNGESFKAPSAEGLPLSDNISADTPMWWVDENLNFYKPGDTVPADVSALTAFYGGFGLFLDQGDGAVEVTPDNYTDIFGDGTASFVVPKGKSYGEIVESSRTTESDVLEMLATGKFEGNIFPNLKLKNADLTSVTLSERYIGESSPFFITLDGKNTIGSLNGINRSLSVLSILGDGALTISVTSRLSIYAQYGGNSVTVTGGLNIASALCIDSGSLTVTGDTQAVTLPTKSIGGWYLDDGIRLFLGSSANDTAEAALPQLSPEMQALYERYLAGDSSLTQDELEALDKALTKKWNDTLELFSDKTYARFTNAWNVTYQPGADGAGTEVTDIKFYNDALALRGALFTRTGYTQTGWAATDGGEKVYDFGCVYTTDAALTLYPVWTRNSSGGSSSPSYAITAPDKAEHGTVTANRRYAERGDTVTITVTPDSGYVLESIFATDKNGDELKLTDKGDGKYTFTMPGSKVEIKATFMEDNSVLNFFYDVPNDAYYYEAVKWAAENGVTGGVGNDLFAPNQPCTRAQIVTFLWRAAGSPVVNYLMPFTDVDEGAYYAEAVRWAASTGIVTGLTETTFGANGVCTRAQAAVMIYRCAQAQGQGFTGAWMFLLPFTDVPEWAYESVAWCYMNGVTTGVSETAFAPGNDCTRAQIVTFLWRAFSK